MATPPFVRRRELDQAIARIHWRHDQIDDPRRSGLGSDPRDVLEYLMREQHAVGIPQWVEAADIQDCLVLCNWLWWEDRRRERALLRRGLRLGLTLSELGAPLGIGTAQGLRDRLDRLDALLAHHHPDEKLTRERRRLDAASDPRQRWLDIHRERVLETIRRLLEQFDRVAVDDGEGGTGGMADVDAYGTAVDRDDRFDVDDEAWGDDETWVDDLREDVDRGDLTPATMSLLALALPTIQELANRAGLNPPHGLLRAIKHAHQLRTEYTRATTRPATPEQD